MIKPPHQIEQHPQTNNHGLNNDEAPATHTCYYCVSKTFTYAVWKMNMLPTWMHLLVPPC